MKKLFAVLLTVCLLGSLCACSALPQQREEPAPEDVTLTFMLPQTHYKEFLKESIAQFEAEYPHIHIDPQVIPDNQWIELVKRKVAVRETPDLIRIDRGLIVDVGTEYFMPFDESEPWYSRVIPEQLESKLIDGGLYGMPIGSHSGLGMVYNVALFREYGVALPQTMQQLREACEVFSKAGVTPVYASDKDSWTVQISFNAAASQVVSAEVWSGLFSGGMRWSEVPEFAGVLQDFYALRTDGYTNADHLAATYASAVAAMAEGNTAVYITGQFFINDVLALNPALELAMVPVPYGEDILCVTLGPGHISIFQDTRHPEEAKLFLDWFSGADNMDVFLGGWSHLPIFKDQQMQLPEWQQYLVENYLDTGKTVPQIADMYSGVDLNDFWDYQQEIMAGLATPDEALQQWDEDFERQMRAKEMPGW